MLASLDLELRAENTCRLPHPCGHLLHAAVLDLVRVHDPGASNDLHRDTQVKPFSLSTLLFQSEPASDLALVEAGAECRLRICCVGRAAFDAIARPLLEGVDSEACFSLNGGTFRLLHASMASPLGGSSGFDQLWESRCRFATLRFTSPTTFRRRGLNVPLPDPHLVYGSLWQKWQAFSGIPVDETVYEEMIGSLALSRASIHTRIWQFPAFKLTGFTGEADFQLTRAVSEDSTRLFGALSGLSFYTGVGYRTTMGMGQCMPEYGVSERRPIDGRKGRRSEKS